MELVATLEVKQKIQEVWEFLANPINSPKWDRSIASVKIINDNPLTVGSVIETTSPDGMVQTWKLTEYKPNQEFKFILLESNFFKFAELSFKLKNTSKGTLITHHVLMKFNFRYLFLYPVLLLTNKKALRRDLDSLKNTLNEVYN